MARQITPQTIDPAEVNGWGVDADPQNDPTYPIRDRSVETGKDWNRPKSQRTDIEVLQSMEYNRRPAVFGTSAPPSGISGMMRRAAFGYSESDWRHWLMLLGADRVNMVEGLVEDLAHGRVPNLPAELGAGAEWRHNRDGLVRKLAIGAGVAVVAVALLGRNKSPRHPARRRL